MYVAIASGRVSTVYNSGSVTAGTSYNGGFAYDSTGQLQVDTAAVPATKSISQGISRTSDGVLCVNTHDPSLESYLYLPAAASNTATTPNQTITGNQTITFEIALTDYTPVADVTLFTKSSGNDGFIVKWLTTDKVRLVVGDGVALTNVDVVTASSFTDGSTHTVKIVWEDGVGATFYYDGVVSGSQVAAAKTLTNAAVAMTIGSTTSSGKVFTFQVGAVFDFNADDWSETSTNGATQASSATGEVWTLNNAGSDPAILLSPARGHGGLFTDNSGALYVHVTDAVSSAIGGIPVTAKGAIAVSAVT